jgi:hypothetical protein
LARYQIQREDYRQLKKVYDEDRKNFDASLDAYRNKHALEPSYAQQGWEWMTGKSLPYEPQEPTLKDMAQVLRNRFCQTARERAQEAYGLQGYLLRNHGLAGIIEEFDTDLAPGAERPEAGSPRPEPSDSKVNLNGVAQ